MHWLNLACGFLYTVVVLLAGGTITQRWREGHRWNALALLAFLFLLCLIVFTRITK
jgi:phosphoglycerol transferase MdoB-like AlkP superfamily enzyme